MDFLWNSNIQYSFEFDWSLLYFCVPLLVDLYFRKNISEDSEQIKGIHFQCFAQTFQSSHNAFNLWNIDLFLSLWLPTVLWKRHIFSPVYGCAFIPGECTPITRFQSLWQRSSTRKPNTSQFIQCTLADTAAHTHVHTHTASVGPNTHNLLTQYTLTRWKGQFIKPAAGAGLRRWSASVGLVEKRCMMCLWSKCVQHCFTLFYIYIYISLSLTLKNSFCHIRPSG